MNRWLSYLFLIVLLLVSSATFLYNRSLSSYRAVKLIMQDRKSLLEYKQNDRYNPIMPVVSENPGLPLYFLASSTNPAETSTSWQLIQTNYLLYPKTMTVLKHLTDFPQITRLANNKEPGIIISPFKQNELLKHGKELHPHAEYYIYIMTTK